jgi:SagB-type dehydrogenase family enzyme
MNQINSISAEVIGGSFLNDAELALPLQPRFPTEILMIPYGANGLLFEGGDGNQIISGHGARNFIPRLIALLDGSKTMPDLFAAFPSLPPAKVFGALALLFSRGLLEEGAGDTLDQPKPQLAETAQFLGRYIDSTRVNGHRGAALNRLAMARVAVAGSGAALLRDALEGAGFATLFQPATPDDLPTDTTLLVTLFTDADDGPQDWLHAAWTRGVQVLHGHIGRDTAEIGPLFVPGKSASPDCFRQTRPIAPQGPARDAGFWAGVIALDAQNLISRIGRTELYNLCHVHEKRASGDNYEKVELARLPGVVAAGLGQTPPPSGDPDSVVWRLHNAANGMPPREFLVPRDHQMHYSASNISTAREMPTPHHGAVPISLPDARPLTGAAPDGRIDLATLATLLAHAAGHDTQGRRIAPSAGGLGSANLYLVARTVPGLHRGAVCHYNASAHRLDLLTTISDEDLCGALGTTVDDLPSVVVIGASDTDKTQKKYNNFAFRFAHLDCGVAQSYITDLAGVFGIPMRVYPAMRDRTMALLMGIGIRADQTILTFAAGLGDGRSAVRRPLPALRPHQVVSQLIELSAQERIAVASPALKVPPVPVWAGAAVPEAVLTSRHSVRSFAPQALQDDEIIRIFHAAAGIDANLVAQGALPVALQFWGVAASGSAGAEVMAFDRATGQMRRLRHGVPYDDLAALTIQPKLMEAPFVLLVTGAFHDAVDRFGAKGYAALIGRAGAVAGHTLNAAWAEGIAGCPWGGMCESGWGPLLGIDRYTRCPLFGISFGRKEVPDV